MRNILISILAVVTVNFAHAADLAYEGYMRSPLGLNAQGGKFLNISNPGAMGNEFRIGNETPYIEASFTAQILKPTRTDESFFESNLMFAYAPGFSTQYNSVNGTTVYPDLTANNNFLVQAFVRGGNVDGIHATYWAGKRFYRDADIHMNDFFYFADMSGVGAGVEDMNLLSGKLAVAYMQYSDDSYVGSTGTATKQAIDVRLKDYSLNSTDTLMFWLAEAYSAPGVSAAKTYAATTGTAVGVRYHRKLDQGFNDAAVIYGNGDMQSLTLNADAVSLDSSPIASNARTRLVEHYSTELSSKWGVHAAVVYDSLKNATGYTNWTSIGVRPQYYFTDHTHLVMQVGHSVVDARTLDRITIAPEIAIGKGLYKRPVIRFYVAENMWNDANKNAADPNSLVSVTGSKALNGRNDEMQIGFEGEVWF